VEAGSHPDLAWSEFRAVQEDVRRFYREGAYALAWIRLARPTHQAVSVVQALRDASSKGLAPEDYDGPRWPERAAILESIAPAASELEQVRFDVALTVSLAR
jgi:hypothetical protein